MAENWKQAGLVLMRSAGQESNINLPNVLTLVRILLIPVFVMLLIDPTPDRALAAAIVFVVAAVTDLLDGYVARKTGQITKLGRLLDPDCRQTARVVRIDPAGAGRSGQRAGGDSDHCA
jgi:hypothetical protein